MHVPWEILIHIGGPFCQLPCNTDDMFRLQSFIPVLAISYYIKDMNLFLLINHNHTPNIISQHNLIACNINFQLLKMTRNIISSIGDTSQRWENFFSMHPSSKSWELMLLHCLSPHSWNRSSNKIESGRPQIVLFFWEDICSAKPLLWSTNNKIEKEQKIYTYYVCDQRKVTYLSLWYCAWTNLHENMKI